MSDDDDHSDTKNLSHRQQEPRYDLPFRPGAKKKKIGLANLTDLAWPATVQNLRDPLGQRLTVILSMSDDDHSDTNNLVMIFLFDLAPKRRRSASPGLRPIQTLVIPSVRASRSSSP